MRTVVFLIVALLLIGFTSAQSPAIPAGMDTCIAATVGHQFAVATLNACRAVSPPQSCIGAQIGVNYARSQVLLYCFGITS